MDSDAASAHIPAYTSDTGGLAAEVLPRAWISVGRIVSSGT